MATTRATAVLLCLALAACSAPKAQGTAVAPPIRNASNAATLGPAAASGDPSAWQRFTPSNTPRRITCGELPVLLEANRTSVTLSGSCGYVRVAGDHNDVSVDLGPGGTIEITGAHNDVSWRQSNPTIPASLYDRGSSNSFHPAPRT